MAGNTTMTTPISEAIHYARALRLTIVADLAAELADQARDQHWTHEEYLAALLGRQAAAREANGTTTRIRRAHFPQTRTLEDFNFNQQPSAPRQLIEHLATATFIGKAHNVVFLGPPGVGKTHLAIAIGIKACQQGRSVLFNTAQGWINDLATAHATGRLAARLTELDRTNLIIIDELGYIPLNADAANLLFQLVSARYETSSIIITSNLEFARWGQALSDPTLATALIDRLVHHGEIIALKGDSYRTRNRKNQDKINPPDAQSSRQN
jgi:DNA replication protein DnaC